MGQKIIGDSSKFHKKDEFSLSRGTPPTIQRVVTSPTMDMALHYTKFDI